MWKQDATVEERISRVDTHTHNSQKKKSQKMYKSINQSIQGINEAVHTFRLQAAT